MPSKRVNVTVDLNSTRVKMAAEYNNIASQLNEHTENDGWIRIHVEDLQEQMEDLRRNIAIVCHTYFKNNEEYANISAEVPYFIDFNPNHY